MKKIFSFFAALTIVMSISAETWTVAGAPATIFGTEWDTANSSNDMAVQSDGTYKWGKTDLTLPACNVEFKVCKDHKWDEAYPGENYSLKIQGSGIYTITITFNPSSKEVKASATKKSDAVVIPTIAIAGDMNGWSQDANTFVMAEDKQTATLTLNLTAKNYGFKMIVAGGWTSDAATITRTNPTTTFTGANAGNSTLKADVAGDYVFTWTYATNTLSVTYPEAGDGPIVEPITEVYLAGDMNGWSTSATPFELSEDGTTASVTVALDAAIHAFKIIVDGAWLTNTGEMTRDNCTGWTFEVMDGMGNDAKINADVAGDYVFTWNIADNKLSVTYPDAGENPTKPSVFLAGEMNEWSTSATPFVLSEDGLTTSVTVALSAQIYAFKVIVGTKWLTNLGEMTRENCTGWTFEPMDGTDNNAKINADVEGDYIFTWSYANNKLSVTYPATTPSALDNVIIEKKATKVIRNGQMYILRDGVLYNAIGQIAE
jgi:hypothetical protein